MNDDDLEVVDLVSEDELPQQVHARPSAPDRPRGRRRATFIALVAAIVLVGAGVLYARSTDDDDRATHTSTPSTVSLRARGDALSVALGGAPLFGLQSGELALSIDNRIWIADTTTGALRPAARNERVVGKIAAQSPGQLVVTGFGSSLLDLSTGSAGHTGRADALFYSPSRDAWLRATDGALLRAVGGPIGSVPFGAEVIAEQPDGRLLLRTDPEAPAVIWTAGDDPAALPPVVPANTSVIATDATRVAYASCRFSSGCLFTRAPLVVKDITTGAQTVVALEDGDTPTTGSFSPDGTRLAVTLDTPDGRRVAIVDTAKGAVLARPRALWLDYPPNGSRFQPLAFTWTHGGADLLVVQGRPDRRERRVSNFRAKDGRSIRSFSGVEGLDQVISLQAQPSERYTARTSSSLRGSPAGLKRRWFIT
jgi:hypothetical protein